MAGTILDTVLHYLRRLRRDDVGPRLNDRQLLQRFAHDNDQDAFAALVERHGPLVLGACRRKLRHEADAEDAFQAAFLVLAKKAAVLDWQESVASWLYE